MACAVLAFPGRWRGTMTGDVQLRDVTEDDLPIFFEHQLDPDANRIGGLVARDRDSFMAHWAKILVDETVITKTVIFNGHVAGNVVSFERSGEREVGYWIGREYWGKGVGTKALSEFLGHVDTRPLYARVAKRNVASIRVLEKCGFTVSGEDSSPFREGAEDVEEFIMKLEG